MWHKRFSRALFGTLSRFDLKARQFADHPMGKSMVASNNTSFKGID
jgi:hypothetical protein